MSVFMWIGLASALALGLSMAVSLGFGAILGMIGRDLGEVFETELWTVAPTARANARRR